MMVEADERRRLGTRRPYRAAETDLKASLRTLIPSPAAELGLELSGVEWAISPEDWPRVGPVDLVLAESGAAAVRGQAAAFVELKWAIDDRLWYLAWDLLKSALVRRLGLAEQSFCVVGAVDSERATRYAVLLEGREQDVAEFVNTFHDALKPFCYAEAGRRHPTGPYRLPARMHISVLRERRLRVGGVPWTVTVLEVEAPGDDWIRLDEHCRPIPDTALA